MDKKAKKKIEVLRKRLDKVQTQLKGSKAQADDPEETKAFEDEIAKIKSDIDTLKNS